MCFNDLKNFNDLEKFAKSKVDQLGFWEARIINVIIKISLKKNKYFKGKNTDNFRLIKVTMLLGHPV